MRERGEREREIERKDIETSTDWLTESVGWLVGYEHFYENFLNCRAICFHNVMCACVYVPSLTHTCTHTISSMYCAHIVSDFRNKCAQMHTHSTCFIWYFVMESRRIAIRYTMKIYHSECEYCAATTLKSEVKTILKKIYESFTWYDKARSRAYTYTNTNFRRAETQARSFANKCCHNSHTKRNVTNSNTSFVWFTLHNIALEGNGAILCYRNSILHK